MSNKIKKVLVCILTFVLIFSMIGCNPKAEENTENSVESSVITDSVTGIVGSIGDKIEETVSDVVEEIESVIEENSTEETKDSEESKVENSEDKEVSSESSQEETKPSKPEEKPSKEENKKPSEEESSEETKPSEESVEETKPEKPAVKFTDVEETVYATSSVNVRKGPSTDYDKIGSLSYGDSVKRIGVGDNGWSKVIYKDQEAYISSNYLTTKKPEAPVSDSSYPLTYSDSTCTITVYKEWYENAYVYAAHITYSDYDRLGTSCANGKYDNGYETTSHAAKRLGAKLAINGCYSAPYLGYTVVRDGKIWNGASKNLWVPAVYNSNNGMLMSAWESGGTPGIAGQNVQQLVDEGKITDTFCFGPPGLSNGTVTAGSDSSRAQRTFIGTNGSAGDIWLCVSDGRSNDGKSSGLTYKQCMNYLVSKGCTFGVNLDGGGSSTMYFNGKVLNAAKGNERAVVDFVYFK